MYKEIANRYQRGTITPRSSVEDEKPRTEDDIKGLMASLERLRDAQQPGQNIPSPKETLDLAVGVIPLFVAVLGRQGPTIQSRIMTQSESI
jgi:hypothetical protein